VPDSAHLTKSEIRAQVLAARRRLPHGVRAAADFSAVRYLCGLIMSVGATTVAAYSPLASEPGGALTEGVSLPASLAATGARVLLPVLREDLNLDWAWYDGTLVPSTLGSSLGSSTVVSSLREPVGDRLGLDAVTAADLVVVPALAVDRGGVRLGRGGGSYDRALARVGGLRVSLLYPGEILPALPSEPHDHAVHMVYDGSHPYWTKAGRMSHHWHSTDKSASDGG